MKADAGQLVPHRLDEQGVVWGNVQTGHDASSEIGPRLSKFITHLGNNPPRTALPRTSALTPDPLFVRFYYSHPPAAERLAALRTAAA